MKTRLINVLIILCLVLGVGVIIYKKTMDHGELADSIAVVNDFTITEEYYQNEFNKLSGDLQKMFKNDQAGYLDELIITELLYQESVRKGITLDEGMTNESNRKEAQINKLIEQIIEEIEITEEEKTEFYNANLDQMNGLSYQQVENSLTDYLSQQKLSIEIDNLIRKVQEEAIITKNAEWLEKNKPIDPVSEVLKNGKPTILDLGSTTCVPCQMMQPILEELEKEYQGKANVLVIDVYEYRALATQYAVRGIPTQIFFDANGEQVWRHEGFLAKEEIVEQLRQMGVE